MAAMITWQMWSGKVKHDILSSINHPHVTQTCICVFVCACVGVCVCVYVRVPQQSMLLVSMHILCVWSPCLSAVVSVAVCFISMLHQDSTAFLHWLEYTTASLPSTQDQRTETKASRKTNVNTYTQTNMHAHSQQSRQPQIALQKQRKSVSQVLDTQLNCIKTN